MSRSFKVCEFLSGAAPAGWVSTAGVCLVSFRLEVFGCFGRGEEEWAYEHLCDGWEGTGGGVGYGKAVVVDFSERRKNKGEVKKELIGGWLVMWRKWTMKKGIAGRCDNIVMNDSIVSIGMGE